MPLVMQSCCVFRHDRAADTAVVEEAVHVEMAAKSKHVVEVHHKIRWPTAILIAASQEITLQIHALVAQLLSAFLSSCLRLSSPIMEDLVGRVQNSRAKSRNQSKYLSYSVLPT